jgi:hypothetical protein
LLHFWRLLLVGCFASIPFLMFPWKWTLGKGRWLMTHYLLVSLLLPDLFLLSPSLFLWWLWDWCICWYQNGQIPSTGNGHASTRIGISTRTGIFLGSITRTVLNYRVPICANYQF